MRLDHETFTMSFAHGPHKTLYNRWARWSKMGVFTRNLHVCHRPRGNGIVLVMSPDPKQRTLWPCF